MLRELVRALHDERALQRIVDETLRTVRREIAAEAASLFLYSKEGHLREVGNSTGFDVDPPDERYRSCGTVRLAVTSAKDPDRGAPMHGTAGEYEWEDPVLREFYETQLGPDWYWALLPLDGPNRSYGVLRIFRVGAAITEGDIAILVIASTIASLAISHLRREAELNMLQAIQQETASPNIELGPLARRIAHELTNEWSEFSACVIRIANRQNELELCTILGTPTVETQTKSRAARGSGSGGFVGEVFVSGREVVIPDVRNHLDRFLDREWIQKHDFRTYACFPLIGAHGPIGTVSLFVCYPYTFYETKRDFIRELCRHLSTAVQINRLLLARDEILAVQKNVAASITDVEVALQTIVQRVQELTGSSVAFLALTSRRDGFVYVRSAVPDLPLSCVPAVDAQSGGHVAKAMSSRTTVNCDDVGACRDCNASFIDFTGEWADRIRSELIVPLLYGDSPIGVLSIASENSCHFLPHDKMVAEAFAAQAGALVQRTRFLESASRLERLPLPRHDRDALYATIVAIGAEMADVDVSVVGTPDNKTGLLEIGAAQIHGRSLTISEPIPLNVADSEKHQYELRIVTPDVLDVADRDLQRQLYRCVSYVVVPLSIRSAGSTGGDKYFGVLLLGAGTHVTLFDEERQILLALGRTAAFALQEAALLEERDEVFDLAQRNAHLVSVAETAAGLAHDTNNRLNNVNTSFANARSFIETHADLRSNIPLRTDMEVIEKELDMLSKSFRGLNQYQRLQETHFGWYQLVDILNQALLLMAHSLRKKKIHVRTSFESLPEVWCDRDRLTRVFVNLISNAIDAMKERGKLAVGTGFYGNYAEVRFTDDGIGIEEDLKSEIFKPLFTTKKTGTGLGLVVCKEVVEGTHRGRLDFESRRGRGTTFYVRLPLRSPLEEEGTGDV
ncbi:MAG TPA: GAF domain-containing protein [Thermoanaerobaculia bacterium]